MMFAKNLKPGQAVKVTPEDGGEVLHISQVCMSKPVDNNRTYLKIVQGSQSFAACVLQKDKVESCSVDLFLSAREGIQLALEGGKNELSVIGYFEPEPESESEGEDDMAGFGEDSEEESDEEDVSEDETDGMSAPVVRDGRIEDLDAQEEEQKKKGKMANNKKTQALKALQAAAANDDDDEDDD
ncbi:Chromosome III, complete sequence, related, partial [Eimeria maxima]